MSIKVLELYKACNEGDLDTLTNFLNSDESKSHNASPYSMICGVIRYDKFEIFKAILNSNFKEDETFGDDDSMNIFIQSICICDRLEYFKFLINHPKTKINSSFINKTIEQISCRGKLEMFQYLLDKFHDNSYLLLNISSGRMLSHAAANDQINIIDYIYNNNELMKNIKKDIFVEAVFESSYKNNQFNTLKYLIFDLNIEFTPSINNIIKQDPTLSAMVNSRDLNKSLQTELQEDEKNKLVNKKVKV